MHMSMRRSEHGTPVHVIGGGPGGLATAAALRERGFRAVVLEKSPSVGASWRARHDRLRLHSTRRWSALPGLSIPRSYGRWVARDDYVRYLEDYAAHHRVEVATGVAVDRVERTGDEWTLHANGGRLLHASAVVVATGFHHTPHVPDWPGRPGFTGDVVPASAFGAAEAYEGRDVLVVGAGGTGTELAAELARRGAASVRLAVRTPPHVVRRSTLGWPAQARGVLFRRVPVRVGDRLTARTDRLTPAPRTEPVPEPARASEPVPAPEPDAAPDAVPALAGAVAPGGTADGAAPSAAAEPAGRLAGPERLGEERVRELAEWQELEASFDAPGRRTTVDADPAPVPAAGLYTRASRGTLPVLDTGIRKAVRKGRVELVAAVREFDGADVVLADGTRVSPDVVVVATGYRHDLAPLVGHLGVLDSDGLPLVHGPRTHPTAPGLHFTGFTTPLSGALRELSRDARRIARAINRNAV